MNGNSQINNKELPRRNLCQYGAMRGYALAVMLDPPLAMTGPDPKPNVVFILTDDQRVSDFGCYGNRKAVTPNVDALAARGTRFSNAMVACPVCGPSRVNLLTGRYLSRFLQAPCNEKCHFPSTQPNVASLLKFEAGLVHWRYSRLGRSPYGIAFGLLDADADASPAERFVPPRGAGPRFTWSSYFGPPK